MSLAETPRIESWMSESQKTFRRQAAGYIQQAESLGVIPTVNNVSLYQNGESSVVARLDTQDDGLLVIKLAPTSKVIIEGEFLVRWKQVGVKTPEIVAMYTASSALPAHIVLMECIDKPTLEEAYGHQELLDNGKYRQMGQALGLMHQVKGSGFGFPQENNIESGEKNTFKETFDWLIDDLVQLQTTSVIVDDDIEIAHKAVAVLQTDIANGRSSVFVHDDFMPYNIFATNPLTIYDPNPMITHPYLCLGYPILKLRTRSSNTDQIQDFISGYKETAGDVNTQVLEAAIALRGLGKLKTWHKKGKDTAVVQTKAVIRQIGSEF